MCADQSNSWAQQSDHSAGSAGKPRVALFSTCLVDLFRPQITQACVQLLEDCQVEVVVARKPACCGQPAHSGGELDQAQALARQMITALQDFDAVVLPSGSCAATIVNGYPELLADDHAWHQRAVDFSRRCFELSQYLSRRAKVRSEAAQAAASTDSGPGHVVVFHDACSGRRGLGIAAQPRQLLAQAGHQLREPSDGDACCGFGGAFAVKYPEVSGRIGAAKARDLSATQSALVVGPDLGCLLHLAGCLHQQGNQEEAVRCFHLAEVLAGMTHGPAIGEAER